MTEAPKPVSTPPMTPASAAAIQSLYDQGYEPIGYVVDPKGLEPYFAHVEVLAGNMCWVKR